jgi:hypothetical protein
MGGTLFPTSRALLVTAATSALAIATCPNFSSSEGLEKQKAPPGIEKGIPAAAKTILEQADEFELFSLDPRPPRKPAKGTFHGYKILGSTEVQDTSTRRRLVTALERGIAENEGIMMACFNPRHGIHVTRAKEHADFVICFECDQIQISGAASGEVLTTGSPQPIFNQVLRDAKVPLRPE